MKKFDELTQSESAAYVEWQHNKRRAAFTLAEVLITLGIIGVVAAMTMPSLIQKHQEKAAVTALKKAYSILSQAVQIAIAENGTPDNWGYTTEDVDKMLKTIEPYLKVTKTCYEIGDKCRNIADIIMLNGGVWTAADVWHIKNKTRAALVLNDGMVISALALSDDCSTVYGKGKEAEHICGEYIVDINGNKSPNTVGKDNFIFNLTKYGIIPTGVPTYTSNDYTFDNGCLLKTSQGYGCTAWVIYNENMDYLHCPEKLSWEDKHKCSD